MGVPRVCTVTPCDTTGGVGEGGGERTRWADGTVGTLHAVTVILLARTARMAGVGVRSSAGDILGGLPCRGSATHSALHRPRSSAAPGREQGSVRAPLPLDHQIPLRQGLIGAYFGPYPWRRDAALTSRTAKQ